MCHCHDCQKRTGSVFGAQARWKRDEVTTAGDSTTYHRTGDSGGTSTLHFCPKCGSTVFYIVDAQPDVIAIAIGAFADNTFPPPRISVYESRKHAWVATPDDAEHYD